MPQRAKQNVGWPRKHETQPMFVRVKAGYEPCRTDGSLTDQSGVC